MRLCQEALERGVFAQAIRPPSVPGGSSRLRLTAMASHTASELEMAAGVLGQAARAIGLEPQSLTPPPAERLEPAEELELGGSGELGYTQMRSLTGELQDRGRELASAVYDFEHDEPRANAPAAASPNAPFDLERDANGVRAA
jgi:hypothetical protein